VFQRKTCRGRTRSTNFTTNTNEYPRTSPGDNNDNNQNTTTTNNYVVAVILLVVIVVVVADVVLVVNAVVAALGYGLHVRINGSVKLQVGFS
tara:strand:- start:1581 stop:1856 length:276 start_codon:yes stop_codon:yes gene_type:complete